MGKKASLLATQRVQITILWQEVYSERMIAFKLHCSKTAVHTAKVNFMKYGNYKDRKRSEMPRKSTPRDDNMIKRIVARFPISFFPKNQGLFESERYRGCLRIILGRFVISLI